VAGRAAVTHTDDTAEYNTTDTQSSAAVDAEQQHDEHSDDSINDGDSSSSSGSEEHDSELHAVELETWGENDEENAEETSELQQEGLGNSSKGSVERTVTKQEGPVLCFRPTGKAR
jgi:hypothetical protein